MLMMVDPNVHFHVIPRYSEPRRWGGIEFPDAGWPGPPQLASALALEADQLRELTTEMALNFR
jgi:diadenosine tetraphosphate (Ap4A) HIT family hydrolase